MVLYLLPSLPLSLPPSLFPSLFRCLLSSLQADVARENVQRLSQLRGEEEVVFSAKDEGTSEFGRRQLEFTRAEKRLALRVGAQVMLIKVGKSAVLAAMCHS